MEETQLDLGLLSTSVEVARLRRIVALRDREIEWLSRRLEVYEIKFLEASRAGGSA